MRVIITEYADIGRTGLGSDLAVQAPSDIVASQFIELGSSSVASAEFNAQTRLIRIFAEGECTVDIGVAPVATETARIPLAAGTDIYHFVKAGFKAAAIERVVA